MNQEGKSKFFERLGEIWRDMTAIEFLMRCVIAKVDGEIDKFPLPPYTKDKVYINPPKSFLIVGFQKVAEEFSDKVGSPEIPQKIIDLRNAMAHGLIAGINNNEINQLIKFRPTANKIKIEFEEMLGLENLNETRNFLQKLRFDLGEKAKD